MSERIHLSLQDDCSNYKIYNLQYPYNPLYKVSLAQPKLIHQVQPNKPPKVRAVRMPAPALSAVVMVLVTLESIVCWTLSPELPALGLPCDVPPLLAVTGGSTLLIKLLWMTLKALICSPTPYFPSQVLLYHDLPQVTPSVPPLHWPAAPWAESWSF